MRYTSLRHQIRDARKAQSLSQAALAERSGTSRITIARLEAGADQDVRVGTIERLCGALGLELAVVPGGAHASAERLLEREREHARRLERRVWHARLAAHLLAIRRPAANALVGKARAVVDRWERDRLCSAHYVARWRSLLEAPVPRVAQALLDPGDWEDALFQNTPWSFAREQTP
jgi:transcriptional regulator with XRE-family HTH domain